MSQQPETIRGVIHGKTIVLEDDPGLPDGQVVAVVLRSPGEGITRSAGAWLEASEKLDTWEQELRRDRASTRKEA
jgi:hypothetical protein